MRRFVAFEDVTNPEKPVKIHVNLDHVVSVADVEVHTEFTVAHGGSHIPSGPMKRRLVVTTTDYARISNSIGTSGIYHIEGLGIADFLTALNLA